MKIESSNHSNKVSGYKGNIKYSVNSDSSFIMKAVSTNIYEDSIGSIIREYLSNALDECKILGKPYSSIEVHLPLENEPYFSIKDYGRGMNPDFMTEVYSCVAKSDKRDSNNTIGGFGMGSKCFCSYSDTMTLISVKDSIKYFHSIYINSDGVIESNYVNEDTDEPNGTQIIIPVNPGNVSLFKSKYKYWSLFLNPKPKTNRKLDYTDIKYDIKGNGWGHLSPDISDNHIALSMSLTILYDGVFSYSVNIDALSNYDFNKDLLARGIIIKASIGEVDLTLSRESLRYSHRTLEFIVNKLKQIEFELLSLVQSHINKLDKGCEIYQYLYKNWIFKVLSLESLFWRGINLDTLLNQLVLSCYEIKKYEVPRIYYSISYNVADLIKRSYRPRLYNCFNRELVFYDDLNDNTVKKRLKLYLVNNKFNYGYIIHEEIDNSLFEFKPISELPLPKKKKKGETNNISVSSSDISIKKGEIKAYIYKGEYCQNSVNEYKYCETVSINPNQGGIYLPVNRGAIKEGYNSSLLDFNVLGEDKGIKTILEKLGENLYLIREKDINKLNSNWKLFNKKVDEYYGPIIPFLKDLQILNSYILELDLYPFFYPGVNDHNPGGILNKLAEGIKPFIKSRIIKKYRSPININEMGKTGSLVVEYYAKRIHKIYMEDQICKDIINDWYNKNSCLLPGTPRSDWTFDQLIEYYYGIPNVSSYL